MLPVDCARTGTQRPAVWNGAGRSHRCIRVPGLSAHATSGQCRLTLRMRGRLQASAAPLAAGPFDALVRWQCTCIATALAHREWGRAKPRGQTS